jgi:hypothetical protein
MSVLCQVRCELAWGAIIILFNISKQSVLLLNAPTKRTTVGFASISINKPAPNTCHGGPKSAWNICAASQGMLALLALTTITRTSDLFFLIDMRLTHCSHWTYGCCSCYDHQTRSANRGLCVGGHGLGALR